MYVPYCVFPHWDTEFFLVSRIWKYGHYSHVHSCGHSYQAPWQRTMYACMYIVYVCAVADFHTMTLFLCQNQSSIYILYMDTIIDGISCLIPCSDSCNALQCHLQEQWIISASIQQSENKRGFFALIRTCTCCRWQLIGKGVVARP